MIGTALAALSGQIAGVWLGKNAAEEIPAGRKYFFWLKQLLLCSLIIFLVLREFNLFLFLAGMIGGIFLRREYAYFGMILAGNITLLSAGLIFVYGIPLGTLVFAQRKFIDLGKNALVFFLGLLTVKIAIDWVTFACGGFLTFLVLETFIVVWGEHALPGWLRPRW